MKENAMKTNSIVKAFIVIAVLGITYYGCSRNKSDRTEILAKKTHVFRFYLNTDSINIKTSKDSIVTLTGKVSTWTHRNLAEETVAGLPGVVAVDNQLETEGGEPEEMSDTWIGMKIKTMLMLHRNVSGLNTEVDVKDGAVLLYGKASNQGQKELTTEYVMDIEGVKSVKNDMTVEDVPKTTAEEVKESIDDASITAQVKIALLFHRSTSVTDVKVATTDGVVTVSGEVENDAVKDLVVKLVNDIKGVKSVNNNLTTAM
jgi:osmotically-inducible protein OsmY